MDSDSDSDTPCLSASTLAALKEFAIDQGISVDEEESHDVDDQRHSDQSADAHSYSSNQSSLLEKIHKAMDSEPKEDHFTYEFQRNDGSAPIKIELNGLRRDIGQTLQSTGLTLWRAADTMCDFIMAHADEVMGKKVVELGCGLGLNGILASHFAKSVEMTDGDDDTLNLLRSNCDLNGKSNCTCRKLFWGKDLSEFSSDFDIVMGADVIYEEESVIPLFQTAAHLLSNEPSAKFWLSYTKRNVSIDFVLDTARKHGFEWTPPDNDEGVFVFRRK